jgi:tRNA(His) 5'-end guanylyltransferase
MWFNGDVQKIVSVSASIATAKFNHLRLRRILSNTLIKDYEGTINNMKLAEFDSRVFQVPYSEEVVNYFIWRQKDAIRNSISSVAQSLYSSKELFGKKTNDMQEMILQKGINWDDFSSREKKGGIICKLDDNWVIPTEIPIFTQDKEFLKNLFNTNIE